MNKNILILSLLGVIASPCAYAGSYTVLYDYAGNQGTLAYTFFNLSPNNCSFTPYGPNPNPNAPSGGPGYYGGWNVPQQGWGFFGNRNPGNSGSAYLFYLLPDPIDNPGGDVTLSSGQASQAVAENSRPWYADSGFPSVNAPAIGDSWSINCVGQTVPQVFANIASAGSAFASINNIYAAQETGIVGMSATVQNSDLNPVAWGSCDSTQTPANPCGEGFTLVNTQGSLNYNFNPSSSSPNYQATGGLWSGVYTGVPAGGFLPAVNMLNAAMYPVNLAAYVQTNTQTQIFPYQSFTPVWGGHFTVAVGDPYLVSSFAAKVLWSSVTGIGGFLLNDAATLSEMLNSLTNPTNPVFAYPNSTPLQYVNWLFASPGLAANQFNYLFGNATAASTTVITQESIWGKVFTGLADVAVDVGIAALNFIPGGNVAVASTVGVATAVGGAIMPDMNTAIGAAFTTSFSPPAPMSQQAPVVINNTYASSNLLGLLLTNFGVQQGINTLRAVTTSSPLWTNYSINLDGLCMSNGFNTISVINNLFSGTCNGVQNGPGHAPSGYYSNVYTSGNQTTTQLSIWDAILTGSDVTTNTDGYMVMGSSADGSVSFSPPVQMWNATNGSAAPTTPLPTGLSVNTTFNLNTGIQTMASYSGSGTTMPSPTPPPLAEPQINWVLAKPFPNGWTLLSWTSSYNSTTGELTVSQYYVTGETPGGTGSSIYSFANGPQTINMTSCTPNSSVTVTVTPDPNSGNAYGASGALSCSFEVTGGTEALTTPVTLDYKNCVNDQWATGGVIAAVTQAPAADGIGMVAQLACVCVPDYLGGPSASQLGNTSSNLLGGVVVGASSALPSQKCPLPPT